MPLSRPSLRPFGKLLSCYTSCNTHRGLPTSCYSAGELTQLSNAGKEVANGALSAENERSEESLPSWLWGLQAEFLHWDQPRHRKPSSEHEIFPTLVLRAQCSDCNFLASIRKLREFSRTVARCRKTTMGVATSVGR